MSTEEMISLECPYCQGELYQPLTWFKEPNFTCPACGKVLTSGEFATTIAALEEAMDAYHAEMIDGETPATGCCGGGKGHCSGGGCTRGDGAGKDIRRDPPWRHTYSR